MAIPNESRRLRRGLQKRTYESRRLREVAQAISELGDLPPIENPERRESCRLDLHRFLTVYFPQSTGLSPFGVDQRRMIVRSQKCVLDGGRFPNAMPRGFCKALALDTPLPTPDGWTTMGAVSVGDILFDDRGLRCRVTIGTEVMVGRPCYRVTFDDHESVVCCE